MSFPRQLVSVIAPLDGFDLSLSSTFTRLPQAVVERNEPILLNTLAEMAAINVQIRNLQSFDEIVMAVMPSDLDEEDHRKFPAAFRKALAEDCAVIAIRNPPFDFGKDLVDKAFPGGTIIAAMTHAPDPQTFFAYVVMAGAGLVMIRVCKSVADGGDKVIQAIAAHIARKFDPPPEATRPKKTGKDKSSD